MAKLKWEGPYGDQRCGDFRARYVLLHGKWLLSRRDVDVSSHDSLVLAKRKAAALTAQPPAWPLVGSIVDYCSIIGREPTERAMVVHAGPQRMGREWVVLLEGKSGCVSVLSCRPAASNEAPAEVQVEIRAAELEPGGAGRVAWAEDDGARHHTDGVDLNGSDELPGWLAGELATHEEREARDAYAWPWDITRPVARQYEEWRVLRDGSGNRLWPCDRIVEQTRHDVAASVARHADLPDRSKYSDDEPPTDPSTKFGGQLHQVTVPVTLPERILSDDEPACHGHDDVTGCPVHDLGGVA